MDSKNIKNSRLADLSVSTQIIVAAVSDIPGASIDTDNVVIDLLQFGEAGESAVVSGELILVAGNQTATLSLSVDDATLDFVAAATTASIIRVVIKQNL